MCQGRTVPFPGDETLARLLGMVASDEVAQLYVELGDLTTPRSSFMALNARLFSLVMLPPLQWI